ncbi:hypothetical protein ACULNC_26375 [Shigella flexneri]
MRLNCGPENESTVVAHVVATCVTADNGAYVIR